MKHQKQSKAETLFDERLTVDTNHAAKKDNMAQTSVFALRDQVGDPAAHSIDMTASPNDPYPALDGRFWWAKENDHLDTARGRWKGKHPPPPPSLPERILNTVGLDDETIKRVVFSGAASGSGCS